MNEAMTKTDLGSMSRAELEDYIRSIGESRFRAAQIADWLRRGVDFPEMTNLPAALRARLAAECESGIPKIEKKLVSAVDGTVKYLFALSDGECVETVVMFYKHGTTACISSQVGCRMGCRFCASTIGGKVRDLRPSEMLGQLTAAERDLGERIDGVEEVIGKGGSISIRDDEILVFASADVLLRAKIADMDASELLSKDGVIITAPDLEHDGQVRTIIVYYVYYR